MTASPARCSSGRSVRRSTRRSRNRSSSSFTRSRKDPMAVRTSLMEFQIPRIVHEEVEDNRGVFVIEPLDRGFGYTFGNSLRRVLLSSLEGAAVTDILLNFKSLVCNLHGEAPEIEVRLTKEGAGVVKASDIEAPAELEIL